MVDSKVARRYAKSLIDLAQERNITDKIYADMELIHKVCIENRDFAILLGNPIVNNDKKLNIIKAIFDAKVDALTMAFVGIISRKGREAYIPAIAVEFINQFKFLKGIKTAFVKTATPLTASLRSEILAILQKTEGQQVELKEEVDKDLIGGFVLRVGDRQHDASISTKLRQLKNQFDDNLYVREI